MTLTEMMDLATKAQRNTGRPDATLTFVLPSKHWPKSGKKRLAGPGSPLGRCLADAEDGIVCVFNAADIIDYGNRLLKKGSE